MKKSLLIILSIFLVTLISTAQEQRKHSFDPMNAREGETVEYCHSHKRMAELLANPTAAASIAHDQLIYQQEQANGVATPKATIYYIPVVFHLLHNNGMEKISDDQILDALNILNRDFLLQNADAAYVHNDFNASNPSNVTEPGNVEIQFRLATKAPNGQCFGGITHTVSSLSNDGSDGDEQVTAIINGNDVYNGEWPGDQYLNIFICGDLGGAAGYTYYPSDWNGPSMRSGIWALHNYVGSIGTSSTYTSRVLTHEVGHWLNLPHPWGPTNSPGLPENCNTDDSDYAPLITDTPNTIGSTSCNLNENSCGPRANVENYMDYAYCSRMFTLSQVDAMRAAITSSVGNRNNLITMQNLASTGADGTYYLCKAEFSAEKTTICAGDQIQFEDQSFNVVNGWSWTFSGGTPAVSSDAYPLVTYNNPGLYTVELTSTDGSTTATETKPLYIRVLSAAGALPFHEGFENHTSLTGIEEWEVNNPEGNGWQIHSGTGHTGMKCAKIVNFGQPEGRVDELISAPVDLSVINADTGSVTLSFRYAYRRRYDSNVEWLKVFITGDCGDSWAQRKTIYGPQLGSIAQNSSYTPTTQDEWTTVHMTNITSSYMTDKFRYKFQFESDGGNNIYLDDINIYEGSLSNEIVALAEHNLEIEGLTVYPNPTDDELNVRFSVVSGGNAKFSIRDVSGKEVQASVVKASAGANLVLMDTAALASGIYFLDVQVGVLYKTLRFVVK